ncbi:MAG: hypothetical protein KDC42_11245 [Ignavibacteriae bacterium]|nr:hypothetical protein [Ignavibacteriota bacterium]
MKFFGHVILLLLFTQITRAQTISRENLEPGDILMYNGNSAISKVIMFFDGGNYSHTGIYDGENVLEAINSGVKSIPLDESINGVNYVDVFRYKDLDSAEKESVVSVMRQYEYFGDRYSYEQFMLLGVLTATRKLPLEILAPVVRSFIDRAGTIFTNMLAEGKQPMICSELIYRCYSEADTSERIKLIIPQAKIRGGSLADIMMAIAVTYLDNASDDMSSEMELLKKEIKKFKNDYMRADHRYDIDWTEADFVTPYDLQNSPSLVKLGRLKLE